MTRTIRTLTATVAVTGAMLTGGAAAAQAAPSSDAAPTTATAYADQTVRAFGQGSDVALNRDTTSAARAAMLEHAATARAHWQRTSVQGSAGHVYVTYRNSETGDVMTLGVLNDGHLSQAHQVDRAR